MRLEYFSQCILRFVALCLLTGCSVTERFMSSAEKVYQAFPPAAEIRVAMEEAREAFKDEKEILKFLEARIRSQVELRSLICTQGMEIGRLDSLETVKALPVKATCLTEQDDKLAEAVGIFRLDHLLQQAPLRPLAPLDGSHVISKLGGLDASTFHAASQANVLLVRGVRNGDFAAVEIPSGTLISSLPLIQGASHRQTSLSPNGRVAALPMGVSGVVFLDVERGSKLWEAKRLKGFYAWLPDVRAILIHDAETRVPALLDLVSGSIEPHTASPQNLSWVVQAPETGSVWLGTGREVFHVEHVRAKDGIHASVTREFRLSNTHGVTSHAPTLMNGGRVLFFVSNQDFGSLDLDSGEESLWNVAGFLANRYAKLSENTLLVESFKPSGGLGLDTWVLDLTARTISRVDQSAPADARGGLLMELVGRTGWIRRGHGMTHMGSTVSSEGPQSLSEVASAFNLERQLAKMQLLEQQERAREEKERLAEQIQKANAKKIGLPANAFVDGVGVYQGGGSSGVTSRDGRRAGSVNVRVRRGSKPTILVLSSYEPVQWWITLDPGAKLAGVLLSGYYESQVFGAKSARVLRIGSKFAYKRGVGQYQALDAEVKSWTGGQGIQVFQGSYEGGSYTVGR